MAFDYVTVGHVTADVLADAPGVPINEAGAGDGEARRAGGGAFYSALQAARLGLRTLIVTQGVPRELEALLAPYRGELEWRIAPAAQTTTLQTRGRGRARRQRLCAWAGAIAPPRLPETAILHLAPVARETPRSWEGRAAFVGLTPQGLVREWDARGEIARCALAPELLPERVDAVALSEDELARCAALWSAGPAKPAPARPLVAVTAGARPTRLLLPDGEQLRVAVASAGEPVDDLGAGDVFAAAFFVALQEGRAPAAAAAFANAAAGIRIAGAGPGAIGGHAAIAARL